MLIAIAAHRIDNIPNMLKTKSSVIFCLKILNPNTVVHIKINTQYINIIAVPIAILFVNLGMFISFFLKAHNAKITCLYGAQRNKGQVDFVVSLVALCRSNLVHPLGMLRCSKLCGYRKSRHEVEQVAFLSVGACNRVRLLNIRSSSQYCRIPDHISILKELSCA